MQEASIGIELTTRRLLSIFWLFIWRGMFGGFIFGFIIGFIIGVLFGRYDWATSVANGLGVIVGLIWVVFVMRMALTKRYKDFRIAIVGL